MFRRNYLYADFVLKEKDIRQMRARIDANYTYQIEQVRLRAAELVKTFEKSKFPPVLKPEVGLPITMRQPDGGTLEMVVVEVGEDSVVLDGNHPLAGQDLTFEIELLEIME